MNRLERLAFKSEIRQLAMLTSQIGWAQDDEPDSPETPKTRYQLIGTRQWADAYALAEVLDDHVGGLPKPTPGADPEGFIWLTWERGSNRVELEVMGGLLSRHFNWHTTKDGARKSWASTYPVDEDADLRMIIECLRAVFPEQSRLVV